MPWEKLRRDRSADELRFASIDVHPNVEYAFHAIALDEWRTAFKPTLWGKKNNTSTHLRQVWFPGSHSNVGGGFEDQQIATIAMACMFLPSST
ncbi:peptidoglycan binding domain-containing protein [Colletotrichum higginsianum]|nr:peptidoglycan binding domain-containing protein [Colletotrichum higginsianum]